jgi:hypothetical protein
MTIRSCSIDDPIIILLRLRLANESRPYFMIPAVLYGSNNADRGLVLNHPAGFGSDPKLAWRGGAVDREQMRSPHWHFRADRSAVPMVSANVDGHLVAVGIREGSENEAGDWSYNSLGLWTDAGNGDAITVSMGSLDWPARIVRHQLGDHPVCEALSGNTAVGMQTEFFIFHGPARDRFAYEDAVVAWYGHLHEPPRAGTPLRQAMTEVASALVTDGIRPDTGYFYMMEGPEGISSSGTFLAWAGILQIARPLLCADRLIGESDRVDGTAAMVDRAVSESYDPDIGLFRDIHRDGEWQSYTWWPDLGHTGLVSGHACYLLLKMFEEDSDRRAWADAAQRVLRHVIPHQRDDGRLPSGFSPEDGSPLTYVGYGGCFFVAPLLIAGRLLGDEEATAAGESALTHYWQEFTRLEWIGTDLDCRGAVDSGSSYALLRALVEMHRQTGDPAVLERLGHVLHYAYTYRFGHNTRHRNGACDWSSSGSKVTSTHNVHLDAYGGEILEDVVYYLGQVDDPYFRGRLEDSLAWARQAYNRTEAEYGWGKAGWVTEQYYHTYDRYHHPEGDGTVWWSNFPWAAGSLLNAYVIEASMYPERLDCEYS